MSYAHRSRGFTLMELIFGIAIMAILGGTAMVLYKNYIARAEGTDIVVKYDAIRTSVGAVAQEQASDCRIAVTRFNEALLQDKNAQLAYGFEGVQGGYRPVLTVCATAEKNGVPGVNAARGAYDTLLKNGRVEKGAVLTDTLVSFALPLTDSDKAVCIGQPPRSASTCAHPFSCPAGREAVKFPNGLNVCAIACAAGMVRSSANPLRCVAASALPATSAATKASP